MELIHYGSSQFDRSAFAGVVDAHCIKPAGGLWASPVDAEFGWKQWCESEDFNLLNLDRSFTFSISGNIFTIDNVEDMNQLPWIEAGPLRCISFECLMAAGIDAVHLTWAGQVATRLSHPRNLYGWDCESVLVMNPDIISLHGCDYSLSPSIAGAEMRS